MGERRLLDINCKAFRFVPGDRILVHLKAPMTPLEKKRIFQMVAKWAGQDVEVLLVDPQQFNIEVVSSSIL